MKKIIILLSLSLSPLVTATEIKKECDTCISHQDVFSDFFNFIYTAKQYYYQTKRLFGTETKEDTEEIKKMTRKALIGYNNGITSGWGYIMPFSNIRNRINKSGENLEGIVIQGKHRTSLFKDSNLRGARFKDSDIQMSQFSNADLEGAVFINTDSRGANYENANLKDADLTGAQIGAAYFGNADLTGAKVTALQAEYLKLLGQSGFVVTVNNLPDYMLYDEELENYIHQRGEYAPEHNLQQPQLREPRLKQPQLREPRLK